MTEPDSSADERLADGAQGTGGEAACALHRVCSACGALEDGPPAPACGRCGTPRADDRRSGADRGVHDEL